MRYWKSPDGEYTFYYQEYTSIAFGTGFACQGLSKQYMFGHNAFFRDEEKASRWVDDHIALWVKTYQEKGVAS